jgi:hypothetical protein
MWPSISDTAARGRSSKMACRASRSSAALSLDTARPLVSSMRDSLSAPYMSWMWRALRSFEDAFQSGTSVGPRCGQKSARLRWHSSHSGMTRTRSKTYSAVSGSRMSISSL